MMVKGIMVWVLNWEEVKFGKRRGSIREGRSCLRVDLDLTGGRRPQFSVNHARMILAENGLGDLKVVWVN